MMLHTASRAGRRVMLTCAIAVLTGASAFAQSEPPPGDLPGWSITPGIQTTGLYEDNVLFTAGPTTAGTFMRVTPSMETRYRGPLGFFDAGYAFDREVHRQQTLVSDILARQLGVLSFESRPKERTTLSGRAQYVSTLRPEDVLETTGLVASERRTISFLSSLTADHNISEATRATIGYTLMVDDYGQASGARPGARTVLHSVTSALAFQKAERTTLAVEHNAKLLVGEERTLSVVTRGLFWANSLDLRWAFSLTPHLTMVAKAGPRVAQTAPPTIDASRATPTRWQVQTDALAGLMYRRPDLRGSLEYGRSQTLGFGASGFIDTESFEVRGGWLVARRVQLTGRAAVYRNTLAGLHANSDRLEATASYLLSNWVSLDGIFSYRHQDGALALADFAVTSLTKSRTRNRFAFGVTVRPSIHIK